MGEAGIVTPQGGTPVPDVATDPRLIARRPNVHIRGIRKEPEPRLPADITNMPDAPPAPEPLAAILARGVDFDSLPEPTAAPEPAAAPQEAPAAAPESPARAKVVELRPKAPPEAPKAVETPPETVIPVITQEWVAALLEVERTKTVMVVSEIVSAVAEIQAEKMLAAIAALQSEVADLKADIVKERRNRARAQELADKLLKSAD